MARIITCSDCGEEKPHGAKGMCGACYRRWEVKQDPVRARKLQNEWRARKVTEGTLKPKHHIECIECGKTARRGGKGLCEACYKRWQYKQNPEKFREYDRKRWTTRREVENQRRMAYYEAHKDEHLAKSHEYHRIHADEIRAQQREYYQRNKVQRLTRDKEYKKRRRDHFRALATVRRKRWLARKPRNEVLELHRRHRHTREARKRALPATLTTQDWQAIKDGFNHCCVYCNRHTNRLTQDHIIPVVQFS